VILDRDEVEADQLGRQDPLADAADVVGLRPDEPSLSDLRQQAGA